MEKRRAGVALAAIAGALALPTAAQAAPLYADAVLDDGPLTYLRLSETTGTVAQDASPNDRDGSFVGAPSLGVAGPFVDAGTAVGLAKTDTITATVGTSSSTVELWVRPSRLAQRAAGGHRRTRRPLRRRLGARHRHEAQARVQDRGRRPGEQGLAAGGHLDAARRDLHRQEGADLPQRRAREVAQPQRRDARVEQRRARARRERRGRVHGRLRRPGRRGRGLPAGALRLRHPAALHIGARADQHGAAVDQRRRHGRLDADRAARHVDRRRDGDLRLGALRRRRRGLRGHHGRDRHDVRRRRRGRVRHAPGRRDDDERRGSGHGRVRDHEQGAGRLRPGDRR